MGFGEGGFRMDFSLEMSTAEFPQKGLGDIFGLLSGVFYGASMFFNGYRKDADTTARGVWNFIFAAVGAGTLTLVMNFLGTSGITAPTAANMKFHTPRDVVSASLRYPLKNMLAP